MAALIFLHASEQVDTVYRVQKISLHTEQVGKRTWLNLGLGSGRALGGAFGFLGGRGMHELEQYLDGLCGSTNQAVPQDRHDLGFFGRAVLFRLACALAYASDARNAWWAHASEQYLCRVVGSVEAHRTHVRSRGVAG